MPTMTSNMTARRLSPTLFTVPEAAWASCTEDKFVNSEVDKKIVKISLVGRRLLADWDVVYFAAVRNVGASISVDLRRDIYNHVRNACEHEQTTDLKFGAFVLRLRALVARTHQRTADISAARDIVEVNPKLKGGEFVIKGTRIPVHMLSEIAQSGTTREEMLSNYPLTARQLESALLYAKLHPRRGRPVRQVAESGLSDIGEVSRHDIEELGVYREP